MSDELSAPLGRKRRKSGKGRASDVWRGVPLARIGIALVVFGALGIGAWIIFVDDPMGGRPTAEAPISAVAEPNPIAIELGGELLPAPGDLPPATGTGPSFITLGDDVEVAESTTEQQASLYGALPDLIEQTQNGPLPRVSVAGLKPYEAYARPSVSPHTAGGRKLIAVVVTGLGLSETSTREAIRALPGAVTLAFAPYGGNLAGLAADARSSGHEIMLELPLEPFDYPQNDPGPHTLLVEQPPRDNLVKLHWLLSRMGGYTGVLNHMGARFTAAAGDFGPVMEELGMRGLSYLDDGSSNRSVAPQLARQNGVPFARADFELDTNPSRAAILESLVTLQARADERGWAIATISALPVSIRTLAEWAAELDDTRYLLVPVSALAPHPGQSL